MNNQCYRVVFNKARGMMMVVSEVTKSQNKKAGNSNGKKSPAAKSESHSGINVSYHRLAMAILCCQSMVYTQVQAATSAIQNTASSVPVNQRAALLKAANGTPIVNIRTPNSNGLSHNTYNQFDIGSNGAILNNSIGGATTQLAGAIAGNQYLAKNAANTILNEVRSNAPAKFQGNLEIAGQRADVIIASPSGLQIQGGGFINANQATLTTGTPKIDSAGNLTGFDVKQGQIQFDNAATGNALGGDLYDGKNKNQANYVDVLARAVTINGQIHANQDVNIVSGSNTVDYDTGEATKITGTGTAPTLAVDVSTLGGIYANSINLVGTEDGLGVRNAGNIQANQQIVLTSSGKIENTGTIKTTKAQTSLLSINATGKTGSIEHSGTIGSYGMIDMQADKDITLNKGLIRKNSAGAAVQLMPDIINIDAGGSLKVSNISDIRNKNVDDQTNIYTHSTLDTIVDSKSAIASNGGVSIDADRYVRLLDTSSTSVGVAALNISSKSGTTVDNATVAGSGDVTINSRTADTTVSNNSKVSAVKNLTISANRNATVSSGTTISKAENLILQAGGNALIDNSGSINVTNDAIVQAGELAYLKDSIQPITIGKQLTIKGKQATVLNSTANANDGIYITSQGKATTITNSTLNSTKGAVSAIANQSALNVNKLTTNANSTILAAGNNVGITASNLKADNIVIESGATTTINDLTTAAKEIAQIGGTSISSKVNTSVINSTLNSTGNTVMRSDKSLTLTNNDIQSQGIVLKTNTASTLKNTAGINNTFGDGDITLIKNTLSTNGTNDNSNGIIVDAANYLTVIDSQTKSTGSTSLKSGNLMRVNNSTVDADKHLNINSGNQLVFNGARTANSNTALTHTVGNTTLKAGQIVSIDSNATQSHQNTSVSGGAVIINSDADIAFNINSRLNTIGNAELAANTEKSLEGNSMNTLNGDLTVSSKSNLTIDPKLVIFNTTGNLSLNSSNGRLWLKGHPEQNGSVFNTNRVNLTTDGNINLTGKEVLIEGSIIQRKYPVYDMFAGIPELMGIAKPVDYTKKEGNINITSTDGSVELKAFKNEVAPYTSKVECPLLCSGPYTSWYRYHSILNQIKQANSEVLRVKSDNSLTVQSKNIQLSKLQNILTDLNNILETSKKPSSGYEHDTVYIDANNTINITAKNGGVLMEGTDVISRNGNISILAEGNLASTTIVGTDPTTNISKTEINNDSIRITGLANIYQQGSISNGNVTGTNYSYHQLINQPTLVAKGDIKISAQGKLAQASDTYNSALKAYTTNNAVILNSADIKSTNGNVRIDAALGDVNLESAQAAFMDGSQTTSTSRSWYGKKKVKTTTKTSNNSNAVTTDIQAKNISLTADGNINIYGSELTAASTGNINLSAGKGLYLYAIDDVDESTTDIKKKSSFLGVRYNKDHTNDTRQELSQLPTTLIGGKAYTQSGSNTLLQGTVFDTLKPADIKVGVGKYADDAAKVILAPITNQITTTHTQERESTVWMKTVDQGSVVTTASLPKFNQVPTITSLGGVTVAVPVDVTVDANNKAKTNIQKSQEDLGRIALNLSKQPGYEYLAALDKTNDINWAQVELIQKNWNYTQEGLTPGAAALIAIAIAVAAGPAGSSLSASMIATNAAGIALQTQAVITLINNKGDISKTLKDMASSDTIRNIATAALTAGLTAKLNLPQMASNDFANKLVNGVAEGATGAFVNAAVNGVSLEDALKDSLRSSLVDVFSVEVYSEFVKDFDSNDFADNLAHKLVAAGVGCVTVSAKQQECNAGAIGAAVGEMLGDYLVDDSRLLTADEERKVLDYSKMLAGSLALLTNVDVDVAANSARIAVENNALKTPKNNSKFLNGAVVLLEQAAGGLVGAAVSVGKIGEPFIHPLDTYAGLKQFASQDDKMLAVQLAIAYDLQTRADNYNMHAANSNNYGMGMESAINTLDAVFIGTSIVKAPSGLLSILPALKTGARVSYKGATYILKNGSITAVKPIATAPKPYSVMNSQRGSMDLSAFDLKGIMKGVVVGKPHPSTGNIVLASVSRVIRPADDLVASTKPSTKNIIYKTDYYEDPGHHNPKGGVNKYDQNKSVLPPNHIELFKTSRQYKGVRYAKDANNNIHQFQDTPGDGTGYHWAGSQDGKTLSGKKVPLVIPSGVKSNDFWK
ncbi:two-partner secretion domain-containing protein [Psychrobacter sp. T6-5]|uniref:two-partner secretion domain-containing protein n=1 Tax=Psychrobacter sp. T6-5 TaxID=3457451 RepID=UPI003FD46F32